MAWFDANTRLRAPPPGFVDSDGVRYSVVDYSASHSSYVSETEKVFQYKGTPTNILQQYYDILNPEKLGLLNGHGRREGHHFGPWSSTHDEKDDEFSTKARGGHQSWNPTYEHELRRGDQSPPRALVGRQYKSTTDDHRRIKGDGFPPRAQVGHQPWSHDHDPRKDEEFSPRARVGHQPWGATHDHGSKKGDGFSPKARVQAGHNPRGSPRGAFDPMRGSPRSRDHYDSPHRDHGKYNNLSDESDGDSHGHVSDDDDVVCEDGVCYRKGSKSKLDNKHLIRRDYNQDKERTKSGHSYPKENHNDHQLHDHNNTPLYSNTHHLPPIKTRVGQTDRSPRDSPRLDTVRHPQYGSPRRDYQGRMETTDSGKHGTAAPRSGVHVQYGRTIDSATAAKKYNGVIVPNW